MPDPARGFEFSPSRQSSFLKRIRENLESAWKLRSTPLPAGNAPIHLLNDRREQAYSKAQLGSTFVHVLVVAALLWLAVQPPRQGPFIQRHPPSGSIPIPKWLLNADTGALGKIGDSGGNNPLPPTAGQLPSISRIALMPPHLPDGREHVLVVPVTIADADAPEMTRAVNDTGLPWMKANNNSEGSGKNGIGDGTNHGMGDGPGDGSGLGKDAGPFANVVTQVVCKYCPDPLYSDEARKAKLQGAVTMRVLVGADGRVRDVQVTRGIGLGLDENAIRAVRNWQFIPARDAARQPVAAWITIETVFRLF